MTKTYDDDADGPLQAVAIESLAAELHVPIEQVRRAYVHQLERLRAGARIRDYLFVFVMRRTRAALREAALASSHVA